MNVSRTRARRIVAGLALAAAVLTSGCAAGQQAETSEEKASLDGTNVNVGNIALRGLAIVSPDAPTYPKGSSPELILVIVNDGDTADKLVSISSTAASGWGAFASAADLTAAGGQGSSASTSPSAISFPSGAAGNAGAAPSATSTTSLSAGPQAPITLAAGTSTSFGVPDAGGHVLALTGTTSVLNPGTTVPITFTFAKAGSRTFAVPVQITNDSSGTYRPSPSYLPSTTSSEGTG